jgi:hypothetical protein
LQVRSGPCKDIPILTEEADELAFLFGVQTGADEGMALREKLIQSYFLDILVLELCPRGNNKDVIIIILVHDNVYIPC